MTYAKYESLVLKLFLLDIPTQTLLLRTTLELDIIWGVGWCLGSRILSLELDINLWVGCVWGGGQFAVGWGAVRGGRRYYLCPPVKNTDSLFL